MQQLIVPEPYKLKWLLCNCCGSKQTANDRATDTVCLKQYRDGVEFGTTPDDMAGCGVEDGHGTPVDDVTTTMDVSVDDDAAATDDDDDDNVLRGLDDDEQTVSHAGDDHKPHDRVSLRIDDSDVIAAPGKPGQNSARHWRCSCSLHY